MLQADSQTLMWQNACKIFSGKKQVTEQYAKHHPFMLTTHTHLDWKHRLWESSHSTLHTWFTFITINESSMYYFYYQRKQKRYFHWRHRGTEITLSSKHPNTELLLKSPVTVAAKKHYFCNLNSNATSRSKSENSFSFGVCFSPPILRSKKGNIKRKEKYFLLT